LSGATVVALILFAHSLFAQECEKNMLYSPDSLSYAYVPNFSATKFPGAFTIEFWTQIINFKKDAGLAEIGKSGDTGSISIRYGDSPFFIATVKLPGGTVVLSSPNLSNAYAWNHCALSFAPNDSIKLYLNGVEVASQKISANTLAASGDTLFIARNSTLGISHYGNVDELRFWKTERSHTQITGAMILPINEAAIDFKDLIAYYRFDDRTGLGRIHDFSNKKNEGYLVRSAETIASTSPIGGAKHPGYALIAKETEVDMGTLICARSKDTVVHIANIGLDTLAINPIGFIYGKVFNVAGITGFPLPPDPNQTATIRIQADHLAPGFYKDTLIISSDTVCGGTLRIPISIRIDSVGITFADTAFFFGKVEKCKQPLTTTFTVRNTGSLKTSIAYYQFLTNAGIEYVSPALPFPLNVGEEVPITVRLLPGPEGAFLTRLRLATEECNNFSEIAIGGSRTAVRYQVTTKIALPAIHLKAAGVLKDTSFVLRNTGSSDIFFAFNGLANGFKLLQPASGLAYLSPGDTVLVKIRFESNACGVFSSDLHLTGKPCNVDTLISLSAEVLGPLVESSVPFYDLGASCTPKDTTIKLYNRSDIIVTVSKPNWSETNVFTLKNPGAFPLQLRPGDSMSVVLTFDPSKPGLHDVFANFPLAPCGFATVHLRAILGVGLITSSDSLLDFGHGCDLSVQQKKVTLTNTTSKSIAVTSASVTGSNNFSIITPLPVFTLQPGGTTELTIGYHPVSFGVDSAEIVFTESGCFVASVYLAGVREHTLAVLSPDTLDFGVKCPQDVHHLPATVTNPGNGKVWVSSYSFTSPHFSAPGLANFSVPGKTSKDVDIIFTPDSLGEYWGELILVLAPCGDTLREVLHGIGGPPPALVIGDTVLDFGDVKVGDSLTICTVIENPSCLPITIPLDSVFISGSAAFSLRDSSLGVFPVKVTSLAPLTLCFVYRPDAEKTEAASFGIHFGGKIQAITLKGNGLAPHIKLLPKTLDFGDVLIGQTSVLTDTLANTGKFAVHITRDNPSLPYTVVNGTKDTVLASGDSIFTTVEFSPQQAQQSLDQIIYSWEGRLDTLYLRGNGVGHGALLNTTLVDFGDVRLKDSLIKRIAVTAQDGFPVMLSNFSIKGDVRNTYSFTIASDSSVDNASDTVFIDIKYAPISELTDNASLEFNDNASNTKSVALHGVGVEAHLRVDKHTIDFGTVKVGSVLKLPLALTDSGGYPLTITEALPAIKEVFDMPPPLPQTLIPPYQSASYIYSFRPATDKTYFDTVIVKADAPERSETVILTGQGTFGDIRYDIADAEAKVGEAVYITVTISGSDVASSQIDSFTMTIHYDPTIVYLRDISSEGALTTGMNIGFERRPKDSLIVIHGSGKTLPAREGVLFYLHSEALLGPLDSTVLSVVSSSPKNAAPQSLSSGTFKETDCGNYRTTVHYKGPYSLSKPVPNPAAAAVSIEYELGLEGFTTLTVYDELGRIAKRAISENQKQGKHSVHINTTGLASGSYTYVLQSLEYHATGNFIVSK
jgi:hypothetical protein